MKCKRHISKGTRFNAKKDKAGKYFSTTIWSFKTKCASCDNEFEIKTDPKNSTYEYAVGLRKHEQDYENEAEDMVATVTSDETKAQLAIDSIFRLEHEISDKNRAMAVNKRLSQIIEIRDDISKQDYDKNSVLRRNNRAKRTREKELVEEATKLGLSIPLVEPHESDIAGAKLSKFKGKFNSNERFKIARIQTESIFSCPSSKDKKCSKKGDCKNKKKTSLTVERAVMKQARHQIVNISQCKMPSMEPTVLSTSITRFNPSPQAGTSNSNSESNSFSIGALALLQGYDGD